jgi:hypothetical protein
VRAEVIDSFHIQPSPSKPAQVETGDDHENRRMDGRDRKGTLLRWTTVGRVESEIACSVSRQREMGMLQAIIQKFGDEDDFGILRCCRDAS